MDFDDLGKMPDGFAPKAVRLAVRTGWRRAPAFVLGGVCIHRDLDHPRFWRVTALPAGLAFPGPLTKTDAVRLARRVGTAVNWKRHKRVANSMNEVTGDWEKSKELLMPAALWARKKSMSVWP
jgi:hypothetical protein